MTKKEENDIIFMRQKYYLYKERSQYWEDAYKKPSFAKKNVYQSIVDGIYSYLDGYDIRVIHAGCQTFSVGFIYYDDFNRKHFVYINKNKIIGCIVEGVTEVKEI